MNKYGLNISSTKKVVMDNIAKIEEVSSKFNEITDPFNTPLLAELNLHMNGKIDGRPKIWADLRFRDAAYQFSYVFEFRYSLARKNWKFGTVQLYYNRTWNEKEGMREIWEKIQHFDYETLFKKKTLQEDINIVNELIQGVKGEDELSLLYKNLVSISAAEKIKGDFK